MKFQSTVVLCENGKIYDVRNVNCKIFIITFISDHTNYIKREYFDSVNC